MNAQNHEVRIHRVAIDKIRFGKPVFELNTLLQLLQLLIADRPITFRLIDFANL